MPEPQGGTTAEQERHVLIMNVQTESGISLNLVFRRAEFGRWLANPNDESHAVEVAVNLEEE